MFRPGWVRLNFNFFLDDDSIDAIIDAVKFVARRGADFLPLYQCDAASGRWRAHGRQTEPTYGFADLCDWMGAQDAGQPAECRPFAEYLVLAEQLADEASSNAVSAQNPALNNADRWFALAGDAA